MRYIVPLVALCLLISTSHAQQPTTRTARGDTVVCSTIINAPAAEIFDCFKTADGIVRAWSVAKAKVDFRVGGQIRTAYDAAADLDSDKCIVNTILAYEPNRMLSMKATPPAGSPDWLRAICETGWTVITLDPVGPDRTRVTVTGMGYGQGELFDKAYSFFEQGNAATLELMRRKLGRSDEEANDRANKAFAMFKAAAEKGGVWTADQQMNGKPFRARVEFKPVHDGLFVQAHGAIGDDKQIHSHALMVMGIDPATRAAVFTQHMETGSIARGTMWMLDDGKTVASEWNFSRPPARPAAAESLAAKYGHVQIGPPPQPWHIRYEFHDADRYTVRMWQTPQPSGTPFIEVHYKRAALAQSE